MAGYGVDNDWNRRNQSYSYRNQPLTSSETAGENQSSFVQGRVFRRSCPSYYDNPNSSVSTSNTSYGRLKVRDSSSHVSDQGFSYSSGPLSRRSAETTDTDRFHNSSSRSREGAYSYPHQRNDNFNDMTSKSNASYGMVGNSSRLAHGSDHGFNYCSDGITGTSSTRSAETADRFNYYPSRLKELPISCLSQNYNNESEPASMSNVSHSMPQDVPTFFNGGSSNTAELSRMPPSFQSSNMFRSHENFRSSATEFSKSYPNQRDDNVIDSASMHDTYYQKPEYSSQFSNENYRMPSKNSSDMMKNKQTFASMSRESPVYQMGLSGISATENDHGFSITDAKEFRTPSRNTTATSESWYPHNLPPLPVEFRRPHPSSAPMESLTPSLTPTPREFPMPHYVQKNGDLSCTVSNPQTSRFIGESSSLLSAEDNFDFSVPNNTRTNFRMSSSAETAGLQNLSSVTGEFPKPLVFQRNDEHSHTAPGSNTSYGALKNPTVIPTEDFSMDWQMEQELDLELLTFQQLACELRRLETSKSEVSRINYAASRQGLRVEINTQRSNNGYTCHLFIHGIYIASGIAHSKFKDANKSAFMSALHKLQMPYLRIIQINPNSKELQASKEPFITTLPGSSKVPLNKPSFLNNIKSMKQIGSQYKEYSKESTVKKNSGSIPLDKFIIMANWRGVSEKNAANTLKRSAELNGMLLENEYFFDAENVRCVVRLKNKTLADEIGMTKTIARDIASYKAFLKLKKSCWLIKTKPYSNSDYRASSKFLTKEEFGPLSSSSRSRVNAEFHFKLKCVLENFLSTHIHEELNFDCTFTKQDRLLIHKMCKKMGLDSNSKRQSGTLTYVSVKRTFQKLFAHLKALGGESIRHELIHPGQDVCIHPASSVSENAHTFFTQPPEDGYQGSIVSPSTGQNVFIQSDNSWIENAHKSQSQPEDAFHQEPLVLPSGPGTLRSSLPSLLSSDFSHCPDSSHGNISSFLGEQYDVGMPTAFQGSLVSPSPGQDDCIQSAISFIENTLKTQSQPEDAYHQEPLVFPSGPGSALPSLLSMDFSFGPESSHNKIPSLMGKQFDLAYKEASCYYDDDDRTEAPFESQSSKETPNLNQRKRTYGSRYFCPSKKPKMNEVVTSWPSVSTLRKSTSFSGRKKELTTAWKTEKDPHLKPIRHLALSMYGFVGNCNANFKEKAKRLNINVEECIEHSENPEGFQCTILLNNIVVASGSTWTKKKTACTKAYNMALENILQPNLHLTKQQETNQFVLVPSDKQNSPANYGGDYSHQNISYKLVRFLKRMVVLDTLDAKTSKQKLIETASFNNTFIQFVKNNDNVSWDVKIRYKVAATASGIDEEAAKLNACDIALKTMKKVCWCIREKKVHNYQIDKVISSSDFSMTSKTSGNLKSKTAKKGMRDLEMFLADYASSSSREDLFFRENFPFKARNLILRTVSKSRKLTCKRRTVGTERYLIVGKKLLKLSLLSQLKESGGETDKYKITPPTQEPDADINTILTGATLGASKIKDVKDAPNIDSTQKSAICGAHENRDVEKTPDSNDAVDSVINDECCDLMAAAASLSPHACQSIEVYFEDSHSFKDKEESKKRGTKKRKKEVDHDAIGFDPGFIF